MFGKSIGAFATTLFFSCVGAAAEDNGQFVAPHITVTGTSYADVRPDLGHLRLGVISEKPTAAEAEAENSASSISVIASLKDLGIDPKDIRTSSLTLSPVMIEERDPKTNGIIKRTLTGYRAANILDVKIRDVDKAGAIASKVVEMGANAFQGLYFEVSDYEAKADEQRAKAVTSAMRRAKLFASGASMRLGRLLAIDPEPEGVDGLADLPARKVGDPGPHVVVIPVEPGTQRISAQVKATWELYPE